MLTQVIASLAAGLCATGVTASAAGDPDRPRHPIVELNEDEVPVMTDPVAPAIEPFEHEVPVITQPERPR